MTYDRGSASDHYELARLLADYASASLHRDRCIEALTKHAHAMDPSSTTAGSTIAWCERRVRRFYEMMGEGQAEFEAAGAGVVGALWGARG
jgi:hypothetical protein